MSHGNGSSPRRRWQSHSFPFQGDRRSQEGTRKGEREASSKAGAGCKPSVAKAPLLSSAAPLGSPSLCWPHGVVRVPGNARHGLGQNWGPASTLEEGSAWSAEPLPQALQHHTVTKGCFYYSSVLGPYSRAWAGACPSHPWTPDYGFRLAASPGPPTSQLCFILCLHFHPGANRHDLEIADDA